MKNKCILYTILASMFVFSACSDTIAKSTEYYNPYSEFYSIRYDTNSQPDMSIDFSKRDGSVVQNIKKIDQFAPTWNFLSFGTLDYATLEQLRYMQDFKNEALRTDMAFSCGGMGDTDGVNGGAIKSDSSWVNLLDYFNILNGYGVTPYMHMLGIPRFAQADGGTFKSYPNLSVYEKFCTDMSSYFKEKNQRIIYETWNEPDLNGSSFWTSGMQLFLDMNVASAKALKKGDPDAYVVECGLAWPAKFCNDYVNTLGGTLWEYYMKKTEEAENHIDAFSWHYYGDDLVRVEGCDDEKSNLSYYKNSVREAINRDNQRYDLYTMTQHCTEYSPAAYNSNELLCCGMIPNLYESIEKAYDSTDISRFSWACYFIDEERALINPQSWEKTPAFYVLWTIGRLPIAQAKVENKEGLEDIFGWRTGVDSHRAGAIIYNKTVDSSYTFTEKYKQSTKDSRDISVELKNIPFEAKSIKAYLIDNEHNAYSTAIDDEPYLIMDIENEKIKDGDVIIDLKIPGNAACYIEVEDGKGVSELDEISNLESRIVRKDYYYEERADLMPYSDIYENGFDVTLGMLDNKEGTTAIMVTLDDMDDFSELQLQYNLFGDLIADDENKAIGVRVDYHTEKGYINSCDYYWRNYKNGFSYHGWGTGADADVLRSFGNTEKGTFNIPLKQYSPAGWDGRIQLTYYMVDAGANTVAMFSANGVN